VAPQAALLDGDFRYDDCHIAAIGAEKLAGLAEPAARRSPPENLAIP